MPHFIKADEFESMVLEKMSMQVNQILGEELPFNEPKFSMVILPELIKKMMITLEAWAWAQKPERKEVYNCTFLYPDGWWNHFKCDLLNEFPKLRKFIKNGRLKEYPIKVEIDLQIFYPHMKIWEEGKYLTCTRLVKSDYNYKVIK